MGVVTEVLLTTIPMISVTLLVALLFVLFLLMFRTILRGMNKREIRRALALVVTSAYVGIITMSISGLIEMNEETIAIIDGLSKAFMVVVAFYFGSRAVEVGLKVKYGSEGASKSGESAGEHPRKEGGESV